MAIDTKAKRASVQAMTFGLVRPPPDGVVDDVDWPTIAWLYAGFDYTGAPFTATTRPGWFSFHNAFHEQEFIALMKAEAEDSGNWAFWAHGVDLVDDPIPKLSGNLELNFQHFIDEAWTAKAWCRWTPGSHEGNYGNAEINLQLGEEVNFV